MAGLASRKFASVVSVSASRSRRLVSCLLAANHGCVFVLEMADVTARETFRYSITSVRITTKQVWSADPNDNVASLSLADLAMPAKSVTVSLG